MYKIAISFLSLVILSVVIICLPVEAIHEFRDDLAYKSTQQSKYGRARILYRINAWQGDNKAINNFHVLNYRMVRYNKKSSKADVRTANIEAKAAFERLIAEDFAPAAYNYGMFYYKSSKRNKNYKTGLAYFKRGSELGDNMSRDAADFMRARGLKGESYYNAIRPMAERGNGWAAYRIARSMRRDNYRLAKEGEDYALIGAQSGIADAQHFLGQKFPSREDAPLWLEKAATNPVNRSLMAASDLADLALNYRDEAARRAWLEIASKPREKFRYTLVLDPEGLRWRGFQFKRHADANTSQSAAYDLALMQLAGVGGPVKKRAAIKNLKYANDWGDARYLLELIKSEGLKSAQKWSLNALQETSHRNVDERPDYDLLGAYIARGDLRYATQQDLLQFKTATTMSSSGKGRYHKTPYNLITNCKNFPCYYIKNPIILPGKMFGNKASAFLVNPEIKLPEQLNSHNTYVFLTPPTQ